MYSYSASQWLLFFFIYCFLGWIWESCYVSIKQGKWVNRGFLRGPILPIYGSGAIIVLLATLPVRDNLFLTFFLGMTAATILEYFTGEAMEALFHVRYWDYSNQPFNLNGHICLTSSIAWGFFSILMVKVLHLPIDNFVTAIPEELAQILGYILTAAIAIDAATSFREAMDLKDMLKHMAEHNGELKRMRKRLDVVIAVIDSDRRELVRRIGGEIDELGVKLQERRDNFDLEDLKPEWISEKAWTDLSEGIKSCTAQIIKMKENLDEKKLPGYREILAELEDFKERLSLEKKYSDQEGKKKSKRFKRLLKGNPSAVSDKYKVFLEELKNKF